MKVNNNEKLILIMLSEIHEKLKITESIINSNRIRSAISSNNLWGLYWKDNHITSNENKEPSYVKEVFNALKIWDYIENAYDNLSDIDKDILKKSKKLFSDNPKFPGFDEKDEHALLSAANFFVNDLNLFLRFKGRNFNSHTPMNEAYQRMWQVYDKILPDLNGEPLNVEQLIQLLQELTHPDSRHNK